MIVVVSFALFQNCKKHVSLVFIFRLTSFFYLRIFCSYEFFFSKLFLMEIGLWRAGVIPSFVLNFSLYLLTFFQWSMCIQDRIHILLPPTFSVGEASKFSMSGKRQKLALFEFFLGGKWVKRGKWIFSGGPEDFQKAIFHCWSHIK